MPCFTPPGAALLGTARSWRGILPFTHLAREGRMTVTIGRRELLAALGGVAAAWLLAARAAIGGADDRIPRLGIAAADPSYEQSASQWREFRAGEATMSGRNLGLSAFLVAVFLGFWSPLPSPPKFPPS